MNHLSLRPNSARRARGLLLACVMAVAMFCLTAHAQQPAGEQATVFIDAQRNACIQIQHPVMPQHDLTGTATGGIDPASGLAAFTANATLKPGAKGSPLSGATINGYFQGDSKGGVLLQNLTLPLTAATQNGPVKVSASAKLKPSGNDSHFTANVDATLPPFPSNRFDLSHFAIQGSTKSDFKTSNATYTITASAPLIQSLPVRSIDLTITDPHPPTTTIQLSIGLDMQNPSAQNLRPMLTQIKANPKAIEDELKSHLSRFLPIESVSIQKIDINDKTASILVQLTCSGLGDRIASLAQLVLMRLPQQAGVVDPAKLKQALDDLLSLQVNRFNLNAAMKQDTVTIGLAYDLAGMDHFVIGLNELGSDFQEAKFQQMQATLAGAPALSLGFEWWHAVQKRFNEVFKTSVQECVKTGVKTTASMSLDVDMKDPKQVHIIASLNQDLTGIGQFVAAMKAQGITLPERLALLANASSDGKQVTGSLYTSVRGNVNDIVKYFVLDPARKDPALKSEADTIGSVVYHHAFAQYQLSPAALTASGYIKTSDLSAVANSVVASAFPDMPSQPVGMRFDTSDSRGNVILRLGFKNFMPGKSNDEVSATVRKAFNLANVTVNSAASSSDTSLVALAQPGVTIPASLATLKADSEKTLALGGGAHALKGRFGVVLGGGIALLALIAIVAVSRRKSA